MAPHIVVVQPTTSLWSSRPAASAISCRVVIMIVLRSERDFGVEEPAPPRTAGPRGRGRLHRVAPQARGHRSRSSSARRPGRTRVSAQAGRAAPPTRRRRRRPARRRDRRSAPGARPARRGHPVHPGSRVRIVSTRDPTAQRLGRPRSTVCGTGIGDSRDRAGTAARAPAPARARPRRIRRPPRPASSRPAPRPASRSARRRTPRRAAAAARYLAHLLVRRRRELGHPEVVRGHRPDVPRGAVRGPASRPRRATEQVQVAAILRGREPYRGRPVAARSVDRRVSIVVIMDLLLGGRRRRRTSPPPGRRGGPSGHRPGRWPTAGRPAR